MGMNEFRLWWIANMCRCSRPSHSFHRCIWSFPLQLTWLTLNTTSEVLKRSVLLRSHLKLFDRCALVSSFLQDAAGAHVCRGFRGGRGGREGTRVEEAKNLMLFCCSVDRAMTELTNSQSFTNSVDQSQISHWLLQCHSVSWTAVLVSSCMCADRDISSGQCHIFTMSLESVCIFPFQCLPLVYSQLRPCKLLPDLLFCSRSPAIRSWFLIYEEWNKRKKSTLFFFVFIFLQRKTEQQVFLFYYVQFLLNFILIAIFTPRRCSLTWLGFVGSSWSKTFCSLRDADSDVCIYCALSPRQRCRTLLWIELSKERECGLRMVIMMDLSSPLSHPFTSSF